MSLRPGLSILLLSSCLIAAGVQEDKVTGRWDLTVRGGAESYPGWLRVSKTGGGLSGRYVGRWGAVQAVKSISFDGARLEFVIDRGGDWPHDLIFKGLLSADRLSGTTLW